MMVNFINYNIDIFILKLYLLILTTIYHPISTDRFNEFILKLQLIIDKL